MRGRGPTAVLSSDHSMGREDGGAHHLAINLAGRCFRLLLEKWIVVTRCTFAVRRLIPQVAFRVQCTPPQQMRRRRQPWKISSKPRSSPASESDDARSSNSRRAPADRATEYRFSTVQNSFNEQPVIRRRPSTWPSRPGRPIPHWSSRKPKRFVGRPSANRPARSQTIGDS
jgi:hypothetical protein